MELSDTQAAALKQMLDQLTPEQRAKYGFEARPVMTDPNQLVQQIQLAQLGIGTRTVKPLGRIVGRIALCGTVLIAVGVIGNIYGPHEYRNLFSLLWFGSIFGTVITIGAVLNYINYQMGKPNPPAWVARIRDQMYPDAAR